MPTNTDELTAWLDEDVADPSSQSSPVAPVSSSNSPDPSFHVAITEYKPVVVKKTGEPRVRFTYTWACHIPTKGVLLGNTTAGNLAGFTEDDVLFWSGPRSGRFLFGHNPTKDFYELVKKALLDDPAIMQTAHLSEEQAQIRRLTKAIKKRRREGTLQPVTIVSVSL